MENYRLILLLLMIGFVGKPSFAQIDSNLIVKESFDYPAFNPLTCKSGDSTNWTIDWFRGRGDDAIIKPGNIAYPDLDLPEGNKCAVEFFKSGIRFNRHFTPINDEGQTIWFSFLIDFKPNPNANSVTNLTLTKNNNQVFSVGRIFGNNRIGCVWPNTGAYLSSLQAEGIFWMVGKIKFSGNTQGEEAWLWINPDAREIPLEEEAQISIPQNGMGTLRLNNGFDGIQLKNEGNVIAFADYDEIRIGKTFKSVNPNLSTSNITYENKSPSFKIYPMPVRHEIQMEFSIEHAGSYYLHIFNMKGQKVFSSNPISFGQGTQQFSIDLQSKNLTTGTYFIQLQSPSKKSALQKFIYYKN